jgi:hypothetical protein
VKSREKRRQGRCCALELPIESRSVVALEAEANRSIFVERRRSIAIVKNSPHNLLG